MLSLGMSAKNALLSSPRRKIQNAYMFSRGLHNSSMSSDNYTLYFWDMLHSDPLFT